MDLKQIIATAPLNSTILAARVLIVLAILIAVCVTALAPARLAPIMPILSLTAPAAVLNILTLTGLVLTALLPPFARVATLQVVSRATIMQE